MKQRLESTMTDIAIDWGNSLIKVGFFGGQALEKKIQVRDIYELPKLLSTDHTNIIVSSVGENPDVILKMSSASGKKIALNSETPLPIKINYSTPRSLGVDRISAVCGAQQLYPHENCLIIDMGTCINYELLDKHGAYRGGLISPGVRMRFDAMHTFTARLPLIEPVTNPELIGNSTATCMQSGVMNGILEEVKGHIARMTAKYASLRIILCGGDASFFENQLKPSIFAAPELVLLGLNRILKHNVAI